MKLTSASFDDHARIPDTLTFCKPDPDSAPAPITMSDNRSPHLAWSDLPEGTKSIAILCHDPDVPSVGDDVNQEGKTVPADLPRVDFFHWVLVDLSPELDHLPEGGHSDGVTPRGKSGPAAPDGARHGLNDYTGWFAGDDEMAGDYFGYDGPCPPWNDARMHHYVFTAFALDVASLDLGDRFTGQDARDAMAGHVLASANLTGTYSLNPDVG